MTYWPFMIFMIMWLNHIRPSNAWIGVDDAVARSMGMHGPVTVPETTGKGRRTSDLRGYPLVN